MPAGTENLSLLSKAIKSLLDGPFSNIKGLPKSVFMVYKKKDARLINFSLLEKNLEPYLERWTLSEIEEILSVADDTYYNGEAIMSDSLYDRILDYYKEKSPKKKTFGHETAPVHGTKVTLPVNMGSMDKVKPGSSELKTFLTQFNNPKFIMDKLDGSSLLVDFRDAENPRAYTRGNGVVGHDVSSLIRYITGINKPSHAKCGGIVRGEVIVKKSNWDNLSSKYANARNFVSGVMNRKTVVESDFTYIQFVAYQFIGEETLSIGKQLKHLSDHGFIVVTHKLFFPKAITAEKLPLLLKQFRDNSEYEIDGIIIHDNGKHERNTSGNPKYAKAFKMDSMCESATTEVLDVIWQPSKSGSLKPVVKVKPCKLAGVTIQRATGYNASFIELNGIGKGAKIEIIRSGDVIPKIMNVIEKAEISWPSQEYVWDANHTDIILVEKSGNKDVAIKQITHFVNTLGIAFFKIGQITKAYDAGVNSCIDFVNIDKNTLLKVEGIKEKTACKIMGSIVSCCENVPIHILAAATPCFQSFGTRRLATLIENIPDFMTLSKESLHQKIIALEGFSTKTADMFVDGLPSFKEFLAEYNKIYTVSYTTNSKPQVTSGKYSGMVFLFSGFRDKNMESEIEEQGGKIVQRISSKEPVTHLIVKDINATSQKITTAKEKGIKVIAKSDIASII